MGDKQDVTIPMDEALLEKVHEQLGYNDSRSAWVRDAIRLKLALDCGHDGLLEEIEGSDASRAIENIREGADRLDFPEGGAQSRIVAHN